MAEIPVQKLPANGVGMQLVYSAASAGGDYFVNNGNCIIIRNNATGAGQMLIESVPSPTSGRVKDEPILMYGGGTVSIAGKYKREAFNDANGYVQITYPTGETGISFAVVQID